MRVPRATYRVQLTEDFTFHDATGLVPYLAELGVSDLYASPYLKSRAGSTHGYDVVDHGAIDPELGGAEGHERLVTALGEHGMGQVLDIVPNHVGVGDENRWWMDVLENGEASAFAGHFDISWYPEDRRELRGKVLLPVLGGHYRDLLGGGELGLAFDPAKGAFSIRYYENTFPVDPRTYRVILAAIDDPELEGLVAALDALPARETGTVADTAGLKRDLASLCAGSPGVRESIEERVRSFNDPPDTDELHRLIEGQAYRLAYWRVGAEEINYRRFFAVNDLAGVRVESEEVFDAVHDLTLRLVGSGVVDGLRIDHPDGLYDPAGYLKRLQERATEAAGEPVYVLVEKILGLRERLPDDWPVAGTTGYEFTNALNGLFVDGTNEAALTGLYEEFTKQDRDFSRLLLGCKRRVMATMLASELDSLARRLRRVANQDRRYDFALGSLRDAVAEVVAHFPVYRTYMVGGDRSETDRQHVEAAVAAAKAEDPTLEAIDFVREVLLAGGEDEELAFTMKFQQYTGPVMAKGMEDTALYIYNRLISLNEVGGEPEHFGVSVDELHRANAERLLRWPHSMLATSTHDTKRSEDVRARINALSELPDEWRERVARWSELNGHLRGEVGGASAPSPNDEYFLYQTLLGAWPLEELSGESSESFAERVRAYVEKAIREAQVNTSWERPNGDYEAAFMGFIDGILGLPEDSPFMRDFVPFARSVARVGALNSLSQTLIKLTAPGVPDIYRGTELWDYSLVDPDNRRPVDFRLRARLLADLNRMPLTETGTLLEAWQDGRPKLHLISRTLRARREAPDLYASGAYVPLRTSGAARDRVFAFARRDGSDAAITVAPRLCAKVLEAEGPLLFEPGAWDDTWISLPDDLAGVGLRNVLTGEEILTPEKRGNDVVLRVEDLLLGGFPVALLETERPASTS